MKTNTLHIILCVALCLFATNAANAFSPETYASHSRLAEGKWVKIKIGESGVYAISDAQARQWGFSGVENLRLFGYGGAPISEKLSDYIDDLPLVPVMRDGGKMYFYGQGVTTWDSYNDTKLKYRQRQHYYSTEAYYFVTENSAIEEMKIESEDCAPSASIESTDQVIGRVFHESELFNPGETGKYFIGEDFQYKSNQTFKFTLTGLSDLNRDVTVAVLTQFAANIAEKTGSGVLRFKYNGKSLQSSSSDNIASVASEYQFVNQTATVKEFTLSNNALEYTVDFTCSGNLNIARLDHITVNYGRKFSPKNGQFVFGVSDAVNGDMGDHSATTHLWKVGNSRKPVEAVGKSTDKAYSVRLDASEYVIFDTSQEIPAPTASKAVSYQDIHATPTPDMLILAPVEYITEASRIAAMHIALDTMRVAVLDPETVYNEFSSGTPDAMAYRKLCKMFYDRGADNGHRFKYLLMFSDGAFDNRRISQHKNSFDRPLLLTWESERGLNENDSFSTDAIYAMLDDNSEMNSASQMRIAVGRMCPSSLDEARDLVDKLLKYVSDVQDGTWKTKMMFVADDKNNAVHMEQSETAINNMISGGGENMYPVRIYLDAYEQQQSGSGFSYPGAKTDMFNNLKDGVMWWNFVGHANPYHWSHSEILSYTDIQNCYNRKLPFLYTATCEFTRYDNADGSGGEILAANSQGGAIGLISASRTVFIANNGPLNAAVCNHVFNREADGRFIRIGDAFMKGMNEIYDTNRLRYMLFGDPAMRLKVPEKVAVVHSINDKPVSAENMPTFAARQSITLSGSIYDHKGVKDTTFKGSVTSTLYDAETSVETHGYCTAGKDDGTKFVYDENSNRLAITVSKVENGDFTISLTIPDDTMSASQFLNYRNARIDLYAYDNTQNIEAMGSCKQFYIYGYDETVKSDTIGPEIRSLGLNSEEFTNGDRVNESPLVIARVCDPDGLNFSTAGLGHKMTLTLDDDIVMNDVLNYYTPLYPDDGKSASMGLINYPLSNLSAGNHSLKLKVWDIFNNSTTREVTFSVKPGLKPEIDEVFATFSPVRESTDFYVKHNRPDAVVSVTVSVYNLMGREVWSKTQTGRSDMYLSPAITWYGTDYAGTRVARGIYVYRATITADGKTYSTAAKRIAVAAL